MAPAHAFAQLLAALAILGLVALINPGDIDNWINNTAGADLAGDAGLRRAPSCSPTSSPSSSSTPRGGRAGGRRRWPHPSPRRWSFSAVYYPAAFAGTEDVAWTDCALVHFGVFFGESVVLLMPYYLLRPAMRPLPG